MAHNFASVNVGRRRGFVLVIALVLVLVAGLAAVAVSRAALLRMEAASEAQSELQRRWGMLSCEESLLPKTEPILRQQEKIFRKLISTWRWQILLGEQSFNITFQDDSAKANVGMLIQRQGRIQAELTIRRLTLAGPAAGKVTLRHKRERAMPECFGDIFDKIPPITLLGSGDGKSPAEIFTCWGDGRSNIHRASETVLREICNGVLDLNSIQQLISMRHAKPDIKLEDALGALQLTDEQHGQATATLTDESSCHSLWVECRTNQRSYWSLSVWDQSKTKSGKVYCFQW